LYSVKADQQRRGVAHGLVKLFKSLADFGVLNRFMIIKHGGIKSK